MVKPEPLWAFTSQLPLTKWYGHVHLSPRHVLGQWCCLDRLTGQLVWQREFFRANTICGIDADVIVASEMRSDGPWTADFGCYGISLANGSLIWTAHGTGCLGWLARCLDMIPGLTNELRDTPAVVGQGEVICVSGRVLDIRTGQTIRRISRDAARSYPRPRQRGWEFYRSYLDAETPVVEFSPGEFVCHVPGESPAASGILQIEGKNTAGETCWSFSTVALNRYLDGNFYSYRLAPPYLYLVLSERPLRRSPQTQAHGAVPPPVNWDLVTVALKTGEVVQDFRLCTNPVALCRIEDLDDEGLLISTSDQTLMCFSRVV